MTQELSRKSALASRHTELGSGLEDWNGMGTAWSYNSDSCVEHDAIREAVGMFDMSPLKKVYIRGADAQQVVDHMITRDMTKVEPGSATYGSILTEKGTVCDDAIISNNGDNEYMLCHGSGDSMERLQESADGKNVEIEFNDALHNVSVQGPKSLDVLSAHASTDLSRLKYYQHEATELFGHPCRVSRTGYSGEKGYEIFADEAVVGDIWDKLSAEGVMPCSFASLDKVRIESGLLFFGYDMTAEHTPWEVGLGFTVDLNKGDFRGKQAVIASKGNETFKQVGLVINHDDMVVGEEKLILNGAEVGVVNSPAFSHRMNKSLALAHVSPNAAVTGTSLNVKGGDIDCTAQVADLPFYDPQKLRVKS